MTQLRAYIDGACMICNWEARLIRGADLKHQIEMINIAVDGFASQGFPDRPYDRYLQVQLPDGSFVQGIDALAEIYKLLPKMKWLGILLGWPIVRELAWLGYRVFAKLRIYLPKRKDCRI